MLYIRHSLYFFWFVFSVWFLLVPWSVFCLSDCFLFALFLFSCFSVALLINCFGSYEHFVFVSRFTFTVFWVQFNDAGKEGWPGVPRDGESSHEHAQRHAWGCQCQLSTPPVATLTQGRHFFSLHYVLPTMQCNGIYFSKVNNHGPGLRGGGVETREIKLNHNRGKTTYFLDYKLKNRFSLWGNDFKSVGGGGGLLKFTIYTLTT